jgi:predicted ATPase
MKIFLCGTHSCGKTTLAGEIANRFGFTIVSEAAREIIEGDKIDFASFTRNVEAADAFQHKVACAHVARHTAWRPDRDLVFDRGPDFLVYSSMFSTLAGEQYTQFKSYFEALQEPDVRVFVLDPHEDLMRKDGVRASMDMETAWSITNGIVLLLEIHGIPYVRLTSPRLLERIKTVEAIIKWEKS